MKNIFIVSALSLAIAGTVNVHAATGSAEGTESCVVQGGQGESLSEWGIWCGVATFLSALSEMDPSAAGPEGENFEIAIGDPTGRGEAEQFDPATGGDEVTPHVVLPAQQPGQFVGYFVTQDFEGDYETDEGYGYGTPVSQLGGIALAFEDGYDDFNEGYGDEGYGGEGYGEFEFEGVDTIAYGRFNADGSPKDGAEFTSEDDFYHYDNNDENRRSGGDSHTAVTLDADPSMVGYAYSYESDYSYDYEDQTDDYNNYRYFGASEVIVYQESEEEDGPQFRSLSGPEGEILKDYWAGYQYKSTTRDSVYSLEMMAFVAGIATPLSDIQRLITGDVEAVYTGNSMIYDQAVRLNVNFGGQTFTGEFGDGYEYAKSNSGIAMDKDISFTASGVIDGINLISTEVSADSGFVQGTFFGEGGRIVGGGYDVTIDQDRIVDAFTAVEGENNMVQAGGPI